jgi:hypothetical protein
MGLFSRRSSENPPKTEQGEVVENSFERAEEPERFDVEQLVGLAEQGKADEIAQQLDQYTKAWGAYARHRNLYMGIGLAPMIKSAGEINGFMKSLELHENASDTLKRAILISKIRGQLQLIRGPLSDTIRENVAKREAELARSREEQFDGTRAERIQKLAECIQNLDVYSSKKNKEDAKADGATAVEAESEQLSAQPQTDSTQSRDLKIVQSTVEKKRSEKMERSVQEFASFKAEMDAARDAYFTEYEKYYAEKGVKKSREPEALNDLYRGFNEKRVAYATAMSTSAHERINAKLEKERAEGKYNDEKGRLDPLKWKRANERASQLSLRYNTLVRFNEVVKTNDERYDRRIAAEGNKEKSALRKGFAWLGRQNKKADEWLQKQGLGKFGSRVVRSLAVGAAIGVPSGALSVAGVLGWGALRVGRTAITPAITAGINGLANAFFRRKQQSDIKKLGKTGRIEHAVTLEELEAADRDREKLIKKADDATVRSRVTWTTIIGGIAAGAGLNLADSYFGASDALQHHDSASAAQPNAAPNQPAAPQHGPENTPKPPSQHTSAEHHHTNRTHAPQTHEHNSNPAARATSEAPPAATAAASKLESDLTPPDQSKFTLPADGSGDKDMISTEGDQTLKPGPGATPLGGGPDFEIHSLPPNIDPNSSQAAAWLNREYNPSVSFEHVPPERVTPEVLQGHHAAESVSGTKPEGTAVTAHTAQETPAPAAEKTTTQEPPASSAEGVSAEKTPTVETQPSAETASAQPEVKTPVAEVSSSNAEQTASAPTAAPASAESVKPSAADSAVEAGSALVNQNGVTINTNEVHLYAAPDSSEESKEALMVYGKAHPETTHKDLNQEISELVKKHPNKIIYFQSPQPYTINGTNVPWVARAYLEQGAVVVEAEPTPGLVNQQIDPEKFTRIVD